MQLSNIICMSSLLCAAGTLADDMRHDETLEVIAVILTNHTMASLLVFGFVAMSKVHRYVDSVHFVGMVRECRNLCIMSRARMLSLLISCLTKLKDNA